MQPQCHMNRNTEGRFHSLLWPLLTNHQRRKAAVHSDLVPARQAQRGLENAIQVNAAGRVHVGELWYEHRDEPGRRMSADGLGEACLLAVSGRAAVPQQPAVFSQPLSASPLNSISMSAASASGSGQCWSRPQASR